MKRILLISAAVSLASGAALAGGPFLLGGVVIQHPVSTVTQSATANAFGGSASASNNHNNGLGDSAAISGFDKGKSGNSTSGNATGTGGPNTAVGGGITINQGQSATSTAAAVNFSVTPLIR